MGTDKAEILDCFKFQLFDKSEDELLGWMGLEGDDWCIVSSAPARFSEYIHDNKTYYRPYNEDGYLSNGKEGADYQMGVWDKWIDAVDWTIQDGELISSYSGQPASYKSVEHRFIYAKSGGEFKTMRVEQIPCDTE